MVKTKSIDVNIKRTINIIPITGTDFCKYIDETIMLDTITNKKDVKTIRGITSKENIDNVCNLEPIASTVSAPKMYGGKAIIAGITESNLNLVRNGHKHITDAIQMIDESNYDSNDLKFILFNGGSNEICDLNYNFISLPIHLDYIDGTVDNEHYDLEKLLTILQNDDHVMNKDKLQISNIPYYNATSDCNQTINFLYLMDDQTYTKCIDMDPYYLREYILSELIGADDCRIQYS